MKISKTYSITLIALGAAIIAVLSPLAIPVGIVPITLQTLAIGLIATLLQPRESFCITDLPRFRSSWFARLCRRSIRNWRFIWSNRWIFILLCTRSTSPFVLLQKTERKFFSILLTNLLAQFLILVFGTVWLKFFIGAPWGTAFGIGFAPFILGAIIKAMIVAVVSVALLDVLFKTNPYFSK